jgi:hypothetical protein
MSVSTRLSHLGIIVCDMSAARSNRALTLALAGALLLRAIIPIGYMPAGADSGSWFALCPEMSPAGFIAILSGHDPHNHHDQHGDDAADDHRCPIGHMLLSAAVVADTWEVAAIRVVASFSVPPPTSYSSLTRTNYHSRGPPA